MVPIGAFVNLGLRIQVSKLSRDKSGKARQYHLNAKDFHLVSHLFGQGQLGFQRGFIDWAEEILDIAHSLPGLETYTAKKCQQSILRNSQSFEYFKKEMFLTHLH